MKKNTLKKIFTFLNKYRLLIVVSFILSLLFVFANLYIPIRIGNAIDFIIKENNVDFTSVALILMEILIISIIAAIFQWLNSIVNNYIIFHVIKDIREKAFNKILKLPLKYIDSHPYGDIVSRIISDVDQLADGLLLGISQLFTGFITILGTLIFMFVLNPLIAVVVIVLTPLSLFVSRFISKKTYHLFSKQSITRGEQTSFIDEMIHNLKVVKAFNYEDEALNKFKEVNDELEKTSLNAIFYSSLTNPVTRFVNATIYALVCLFGALTVLKNPLFTVGKLSSFLNYATQYTKPFNEISGVISEFQNALVCANRVFELLEEKEEIILENPHILSDVKGNITLENVSFSYNENQRLIENFNLLVKSGQKIAIVGPTGCGKTTLINLLMRFYDVNSGKILVDNLNIQDISRSSLRQNYGMVLQETWLKEGTIKENIKLGKEDATDEEVINAAKAAFAHSFIRQLPNGYDTVINSDGGMLSVGQKQLLCIARVMLCLPPMLILDEATSSIDTRTELKIQKAFNYLMNGKTSFIVAHRLSTIKESDIILVMNKGNVIEQGNHQELLNKKGFYYNLYNSQFSN